MVINHLLTGMVLQEGICDCKEGDMGKNLRRKRTLMEKNWCAQQDPEDWKWL